MSEIDQTDGTQAEEEIVPVQDPPSMYGVTCSQSRGQLVLHPNTETYVATIEALKTDGFVSVIDLCVADYLTNGVRSLPAAIAAERFEVVVNLISHKPPRRVRVRLQVPEAEPTVATLFDLFPGTENMEREAFDMFGIVFCDHPDPTRILMPPDWQGHPLRKDYAIGSVPVQFKGAAQPR